MSGVQPVAVYAMRIPPGDILIPAVPEFAAMFRVSMAAIDPTEEPELEEGAASSPHRATLKMIRVNDDMIDDDDDDDYEDMDEEESEDDEEANGGPSTKKSKKKQIAELLALAAEEEEDDDDDEDMEDGESEEDEDDEAAMKALKKVMSASKGKGKGKAVDGEESDSDEEDEEEEALEMDEVVICTLDSEKHYQQPLDLTIAEGEKVFFKVSGTHTIHLTGNYVMPFDDGRTSLYDDEDEDDYDLSPDEDELDELEGLADIGDESDELDDIDDPRVVELDSEEEAAVATANANAAKKSNKGKNKRPADDSEEEAANLDDMVAKAIKKTKAPADEIEAKKSSKAEQKKQKKLKNNEGQAVAAPEVEKANGTAPDSDKKKVQFAKNLEQGPTPSATQPATAAEKKAASTNTEKATVPSVRNVNGVSVDDRKVGTGPAAKKGSRIELRYIGKLDDGKVFDSNKSGKPFSMKLGSNEVIKGWEIGLQGIATGGERRLIIPANLAYGNKANPGIPKNSRLTFDVKCLSVK